MPVYPNDMLTPTFLTGVIQNRPEREAIKMRYIGTTLMPFKEVAERKLSWDVVYAENNLAGFYDLKGQAIPGDDVMFSTVFANLIDVKASRHLDPDMIAMMRDPGMPAVYRAAGDSPTIQARQARERQHLQERIGWSDDAVDAQVEYLCLGALQGEIRWPPRAADGSAISNPMPHWNADMPVSIVFPMRNEFKQKASTLVGLDGRVNETARVPWTDITADILQDLEILAELYVETTGRSLEEGRLIMSRRTLSRIAFNTKFLTAIGGTNREQPGARQFASIAEVKNFISTNFGWTIETYDAHWTYRTHVPGSKPTISMVPFLKRGKVLILPKGETVGNVATTFLRRADGSYQSGKYAWSYETPKPPHEIEVGVNLVAWPILEHYDWMTLDTEE